MKKREFITSDFETIIENEEHKVIMFAVFDGLNHYSLTYKECKTDLIERLLAFLFKEYNNTTVYFHNLGKFDGLFILKYLYQQNIYKFRPIMRDNTIYQISVKLGNKKISFKDSYLILPLSLREAALTFNKTYFKADMEFKTALTVQELKHMQKYCINDAQSLYESLSEYKKMIEQELHIDILNKLTLPALSLSAFKRKVELNHINMYAYQFFRKGYVGGISDIYKPYGKNLVKLDVNGLYPYVMAKHRYGYGKLYRSNKIDDLYEFCQKYHGFLYVKIECSKSLRLPLICIKKDERNIQGYGNFEAVVYSKEILYCLKNYPQYYQFQALHAEYYKESRYLFKDFIEEMYKIKQKYEGNKSRLIKLIMNSLYGRLGIDIDKPETLVSTDITEIFEIINQHEKIENVYENDEFYHITYIDENVDNRLSKMYRLNARPDLAAAITSEARMYMQELKEKVDVYYTDTDSLIIKEEEMAKIDEYLNDKELGKLKIEGYYQQGLFIAPKSYILEDYEHNYEIKMKGMKKEELDVYDKRELFQLLYAKSINQADPFQFTFTRSIEFFKNWKELKISNRKININTYPEFNKRDKVYNEKQQWVDTWPKKIN